MCVSRGVQNKYSLFRHFSLQMLSKWIYFPVHVTILLCELMWKFEASIEISSLFLGLKRIMWCVKVFVFPVAFCTLITWTSVEDITLRLLVRPHLERYFHLFAGSKNDLFLRSATHAQNTFSHSLFYKFSIYARSWFAPLQRLQNE